MVKRGAHHGIWGLGLVLSMFVPSQTSFAAHEEVVLSNYQDSVHTFSPKGRHTHVVTLSRPGGGSKMVLVRGILEGTSEEAMVDYFLAWEEALAYGGEKGGGAARSRGYGKIQASLQEEPCNEEEEEWELDPVLTKALAKVAEKGLRTVGTVIAIFLQPSETGYEDWPVEIPNTLDVLKILLDEASRAKSEAIKAQREAERLWMDMQKAYDEFYQKYSNGEYDPNDPVKNAKLDELGKKRKWAESAQHWANQKTAEANKAEQDAQDKFEELMQEIQAYKDNLESSKAGGACEGPTPEEALQDLKDLVEDSLGDGVLTEEELSQIQTQVSVLENAAANEGGCWVTQANLLQGLLNVISNKLAQIAKSGKMTQSQAKFITDMLKSIQDIANKCK